MQSLRLDCELDWELWPKSGMSATISTELNNSRTFSQNLFRFVFKPKNGIIHLQLHVKGAKLNSSKNLLLKHLKLKNALLRLNYYRNDNQCRFYRQQLTT